jgi:hypothetical protein
VTPAAPPAFDTVEEVLAVFAHEPTVLQVQAWAHVWAGTDPEVVRGWVLRSTTFAALPEVTLDLGLGFDHDQGFLYLDEHGLSPIPGSVPIPVIDDAGEGRSVDLDLELRWDLPSLRMSSEKIRMISEAQDLAELRQEVRTEVTRVYFDRRRLQVDQLLAPAADLASRVEGELRIRELTALLDALTGGEFGAALDRREAER